MVKKAFKFVSNGGIKNTQRKDFFVTMKIHSLSDRDHIIRLLDACYLEYFDLLILHSPFRAFRSVGILSMQWRLFCKCKKEKLARSIGVSNFYVPHLEELFALCKKGHMEFPRANQIQLNLLLLHDNKDLVDYCFQHGMQVIAYSPLGFCYSEIVLKVESIADTSKHLRITEAQLCLGYLMLKGIKVIPKSSNEERMTENFRTTTVYQPSFQDTVNRDVLPELNVDSQAYNYLYLETSEGAKKHSQEKHTWHTFL
jgi:diketogulonate reductase-like aldo/keto reductase